MSTKRTRRTRLIRWGLPLAMALLVPTGYWGYLSSHGNFHPITPGEAYRSAQLDEALLTRYIRDYGIRSVINLRTANDSADWYGKEVRACARLGVEHRNLPLTAYAAPTAEQVKKLINLFETLPRPVLIHCRAGADRSGIAAAIWKVVVDGATKEEAKAQLSLRYGHVSMGATGVLDDFFETWEPPAADTVPLTGALGMAAPAAP